MAFLMKRMKTVITETSYNSYKVKVFEVGPCGDKQELKAEYKVDINLNKYNETDSKFIISPLSNPSKTFIRSWPRGVTTLENAAKKAVSEVHRQLLKNKGGL